MKIICVGRNYADHAKELKNDIPDKPVIFLKPDSAIPPKGQPFFYPSFSNDVHYEGELVVKINRVGKNIQSKFAPKYYNEISLGIDFTARDIQTECKNKGLPWERAKAFDGSAPVGKFIDKAEFEDIQQLSFSIKINDELKQRGNTKDMLFSINDLIEEISSIITLKIGDLIFTGTPAGVGPIGIGDRIQGFIENKAVLNLKIK